MNYTVKEIEESIAYCGLVCRLCNEGKSGQCKGCHEKSCDCAIKACAKEKHIKGCWECKEYPCEEEMFKSNRVRAFMSCTREEGLHQLAVYLKKNADSGIQYHKEDGSRGDYDVLSSEEEILALLRRGVL